MRKKIVAGNWKMNKTLGEAIDLAEQIGVHLSANSLSSDEAVVLCVPSLYLTTVRNRIRQSGVANWYVGAQNCHWQNSGAFTGEISAAMLQSAGADCVILGHSERREYFGETDEMLKNKVSHAADNGLPIIFCCGESLTIREADQQLDWITKQLHASLFYLNDEQIQNVAIAYEPIWAIGTGKTATPDQAQTIHAHIRQLLQARYGELATEVSILYGGSCNAQNAATLFAQKDIDGGLIGGASLKVEDFVAIIQAMMQS
jgi:triosephosphate isomerase